MSGEKKPKDNGGYMFPPTHWDIGNGPYFDYGNWTVRDEFAARALAGYIASYAGHGGFPSPSEAAAAAFGYADAMLAERTK